MPAESAETEASTTSGRKLDLQRTKRVGLKQGDLAGLKGSDPRKVALAKLVWEKTTVSQDWIARDYKCGVRRTVASF